MLVLSRKRGEQVRINDDIEVVVLDIRGDRVRLGFVAPDDVSVYREEVHRRIEQERPAPTPTTRRERLGRTRLAHAAAPLK
jgi:carbon storage regulator